MEDYRDYPKNVSLGIGFQSVINATALNSAVGESEDDNNSNSQISIHSETGTDFSSMLTKVDLALSAKTSGLPTPVSGSVAAKAHFESSDIESHTYSIITVEKVSKVLGKKNVGLTNDALSLIGREQWDSFYARYGEKFVRSITHGNKIVVVLRTDKKDTETLKQLETEVALNPGSAELQAKLGLLRNKINSTKHEDRFVRVIGNDKPLEFIDEKDLQNKLDQYLKDESSAIIDYALEPYSSAKNFPQDDGQISSNLSARIKTDIQNFLVRIAYCIDQINKSEILNLRNIVEINDFKGKSRCQGYENYEVMKAEAKRHMTNLLELKGNFGKEKKLPSKDEKAGIDASLREIEEWLDKQKALLPHIAKHTLVRKILLQRDLSKTKGFKLILNDEMKRAAQYLLVKFDEPAAKLIKVMARTKFRLFACPTEEQSLSADGCYLDSKLGRRILGIKMIEPEKLSKDVYVYIYASTEASQTQYDVAALNERNQAIRRLDGAVGDDFVYEGYDDEERKQGYLAYNTEEGTEAELYQELGLLSRELEEFEIETESDVENEIGLGQENDGQTRLIF